jgi:hypothetical protein
MNKKYEGNLFGGGEVDYAVCFCLKKVAPLGINIGYWLEFPHVKFVVVAKSDRDFLNQFYIEPKYMRHIRGDISLIEGGLILYLLRVRLVNEEVWDLLIAPWECRSKENFNGFREEGTERKDESVENGWCEEIIEEEIKFPIIEEVNEDLKLDFDSIVLTAEEDSFLYDNYVVEEVLDSVRREVKDGRIVFTPTQCRLQSFQHAFKLTLEYDKRSILKSLDVIKRFSSSLEFGVGPKDFWLFGDIDKFRYHYEKKKVGHLFSVFCDFFALIGEEKMSSKDWNVLQNYKVFLDLYYEKGFDFYKLLSGYDMCYDASYFGRKGKLDPQLMYDKLDKLKGDYQQLVLQLKCYRIATESVLERDLLEFELDFCLGGVYRNVWILESAHKVAIKLCRCNVCASGSRVCSFRRFKEIFGWILSIYDPENEKGVYVIGEQKRKRKKNRIIFVEQYFDEESERPEKKRLKKDIR